MATGYVSIKHRSAYGARFGFELWFWSTMHMFGVPSTCSTRELPDSSIIISKRHEALSKLQPCVSIVLNSLPASVTVNVDWFCQHSHG